MKQIVPSPFGSQVHWGRFAGSTSCSQVVFMFLTDARHAGPESCYGVGGAAERQPHGDYRCHADDDPRTRVVHVIGRVTHRR